MKKENYTPSEQKAIDNIANNPDRKILEITRARGGMLIITFEKLSVRKTDKHEHPFKYRSEWYGKLGARLGYKTGNILDEDGITILDDWTESFASHRNGYKNS